jgi:hypothetical protein
MRSARRLGGSGEPGSRRPFPCARGAGVDAGGSTDAWRSETRRSLLGLEFRRPDRERGRVDRVDLSVATRVAPRPRRRSRESTRHPHLTFGASTEGLDLGGASPRLLALRSFGLPRHREQSLLSRDEEVLGPQGQRRGEQSLGLDHCRRLGGWRDGLVHDGGHRRSVVVASARVPRISRPKPLAVKPAGPITNIAGLQFRDWHEIGVPRAAVNKTRGFAVPRVFKSRRDTFQRLIYRARSIDSTE